MEKMPKFNTKNEKKTWNVHKIGSAHLQAYIFNMWTIIMQSLNKKEWILLELQITQTRHPKAFWMEKMSKLNTPQK